MTGDSTEQTLKTVCDNKFFEKCEIPVDFKYGKKSMEDSMTSYLKGNDFQFDSGRAIFMFIVAKNSKIYDVRKISGSIADESNIIKALQQTANLWTVGKQNSYLICSYVRLEVEFIDNRVKVNLINSYK